MLGLGALRFGKPKGEVGRDCIVKSSSRVNDPFGKVEPISRVERDALAYHVLDLVFAVGGTRVQLVSKANLVKAVAQEPLLGAIQLEHKNVRDIRVIRQSRRIRRGHVEMDRSIFFQNAVRQDSLDQSLRVIVGITGQMLDAKNGARLGVVSVVLVVLVWNGQDAFEPGSNRFLRRWRRLRQISSGVAVEAHDARVVGAVALGDALDQEVLKQLLGGDCRDDVACDTKLGAGIKDQILGWNSSWWGVIQRSGSDGDSNGGEQQEGRRRQGSGGKKLHDDTEVRNKGSSYKGKTNCLVWSARTKIMSAQNRSE